MASVVVDTSPTNGHAESSTPVADAPIRKRAPEDKSEKKQPPVKRRRTTTTTATPKRTAKSKAPAKKKNVVVESESEDSSSDSDDSVSSDSSSDDAEPPKPAPKPSVKAKAKTPTPKPAVAKAPVRTSVTAADILKQPNRQLTSNAIDELVPLILRYDRPSDGVAEIGEDDGKILVISSINLQAVLSRFMRGSDPVTPENVYKLLGVTREKVDRADVVAVVLHGPHTEEERFARLKYEGATTQNFHWSLVCWFREVPDEPIHYDSRYPLNDNRCTEVLGMLRALGVLPKTMQNYVLPEFFPQQEEEWECGYEVLIALSIIASSPVPEPITDADIDTSYRTFFASLSTDGIDAPFIRRLRELLAREKYAF